MIFIETSVFTRQVLKLLSDDDYRDLQSLLILSPETGKLIRGSGGLRKLRWAAKGHGKRGGVRLIYYWAVEDYRIYMVYLYAKNQRDDLTIPQLRMLRQTLEED